LEPDAILPPHFSNQIVFAGHMLHRVVGLECVKKHFEALARPVDILVHAELESVSFGSDPMAGQRVQLDDDNDEELGYLDPPHLWATRRHWEALPRFLQFATAYPNATHRLCRSSRSRGRFLLSKLQVQLLPTQGPVTSDMDSVYGLVAELKRITPDAARATLIDAGIVDGSVQDAEQFTGKVHCEAVLATFIHLAATGYQSPLSDQPPVPRFKNARPIFGISELCCPCCAELLRLLGDSDYIHRGQHSNFYACSLPEHLPLSVLQGMELFAKEALQASLQSISTGRSTADSEGDRSSSSDDTFGPHSESVKVFTRYLVRGRIQTDGPA
jgi:hypothetical protein